MPKRTTRRQAIGAAISACVTKGAQLNPRLFSFIGGKAGRWTVIETKAVTGASLPPVERLEVVQGASAALKDGSQWILRGVTSNARYVNDAERKLLASKQADLGRAEAANAAMIPIRKNAAWWDLTQEQRRKIFEETSHHTEIGAKYLPRIARRLHHCRDLESAEPFDFITWFDYAPADARAFEDLVGALRRTEEWKFVDREVDIRLAR